MISAQEQQTLRDMLAQWFGHHVDIAHFTQHESQLTAPGEEL